MNNNLLYILLTLNQKSIKKCKIIKVFVAFYINTEQINTHSA